MPKRLSQPNPVSLPLTIFPSNPACQECDLHEGARSVCIPTRRWASSSTPIEQSPPARRALLVVGMAPGYQENSKGMCFVGASGDKLSDWLSCCDLDCDVYLTNTVRCYVPSGDTVPPKSIKACRSYFAGDVGALHRAYAHGDPRDLVVLALGAVAAKATMGVSSLDDAFHCQGEPQPFILPDGSTVNLPCFATFHPAYTMTGRNPHAETAVQDHFALLMRYLRTGSVCADLDLRIGPAVPPAGTYLLSLDIETYGMMAETPQTCFNPQRSRHWDGVPYASQILTVALAAPDGYCATFNMQNASERNLLLRILNDHRGVILGQNIQFDLQYLRECYPTLHTKARIEDLLVWNYLESDVRPERSLKTVSPLLGITAYTDSQRSVGHYRSASDSNLHMYNAKDAVATLHARNILRERIRTTFPDTAKLSRFTHQWYSDLINLAVSMSRTGIPMNRRMLIEARKQTEQEIEAVTAACPIPAVGKGSQKALAEVVDRSVDITRLHHHQDLEKTKKTRKISTSELNLDFIRGHMDESPDRSVLDQVTRAQSLRKLLGTYLHPLTAGRSAKDKPPDIIPLENNSNIGIAHPSWFIVPAVIRGGSGEQTASGGTKQGRITCKDPAVQTFPPSVKNAICSRYIDGYVMLLDLSQIELRVAAFISGDPVMLDEYARKVDRHWLRAMQIFGGDPCPTHGDRRDKGCPDCDQKRQVGKTVNFLLLYRGGAWRLRLTLRMDMRFDPGLPFCEDVVEAVPTMYPYFWNWQDEHIRRVTSAGYWADPVLGQGRRFSQSIVANQVDESTLVNTPVQLIAADCMLAGQMALFRQLAAKRFRSRIVANIYDAIVVEGPGSERDAVTDLAYTCILRNEYLDRLQTAYGREFPMAAEHKFLVGGPAKKEKGT